MRINIFKNYLFFLYRIYFNSPIIAFSPFFIFKFFNDLFVHIIFSLNINNAFFDPISSIKVLAQSENLSFLSPPKE